ncbi:AAA family ATPase [Nocardiopsis synnemataformans]|uniref:AAA family ATPase n=1 Tax=Nocardiopsis synnemataformans TaxID=61305 RepID=UPI003EB91A5E
MPTIISTGPTFRLFDQSVQTHDALPAGTYKVQFSPLAGFTLHRTIDLATNTQDIYGEHTTKLDRIMRAYDRSGRALGVLFSGDKGMGKSLMVRMLAERVRIQLGLPVIIVDSDADGLADFLDSLGECLVIFDEFEKVFPARTQSDQDNRQNQFLGLFDGASTAKRLYVVSVNELDDLSDYFVNRPGRFHYHMRFAYPSADDVRRYLRNQAPKADDTQVDEVVAFSRKVNLNYDHLRAIASELNAGEFFKEVIGDLNIKKVESVYYTVTSIFADNTRVTTSAPLDLFANDSKKIFLMVEHPSGTDVSITFPRAAVTHRGDLLEVSPSALNSSVYTYDDEERDIKETNPAFKVVGVELAVQGQRSFAY